MAEIDKYYRQCEKITKSHYENFPVGSLLIPRKRRKYIYSIYAFARYADDIADSGKLSSGEKIEKLDELDEILLRVNDARVESQEFPEDTEYFFRALFHTVKHLNIPVEEFRNLLKAFRQDALKSRYETFEDLLEYSKYSANPVGHLVLYVFGYNPASDSFAFESSDKVCSALQLTNFWQDVKRDLEIGRIYIPEEVMTKNKYSYEDLLEKNENDNFRKVIKELVDKTEKLFDEGKGITGYTGGRLKYELKATIFGGMEVLNKIRKINYNVLSKRPYIKNIDKLKILIQALWK